MSKINLGILGGGQLGSMLATAAKKLNVQTIIYSDDKNAPAQKFADDFILGDYNDENKISEFVNKVNVVTYEFENIPFNTLEFINKHKQVLPKPNINQIIQNRFSEKNFINELGIKTTDYVIIKNLKDFLLLISKSYSKCKSIPSRPDVFLAIDNISLKKAESILLRMKYKYDGLVVSDALVMNAISNKYSSGSSALLAFNAGIDLIMMPKDIDEAINSLTDAFYTEKISIEISIWVPILILLLTNLSFTYKINEK